MVITKASQLKPPVNRSEARDLIAYGRQIARDRSNRADIERAADLLEAAWASDGPLHDRIMAMTNEQLNRFNPAA